MTTNYSSPSPGKPAGHVFTGSGGTVAIPRRELFSTAERSRAAARETGY